MKDSESLRRIETSRRRGFALALLRTSPDSMMVIRTDGTIEFMTETGLKAMGQGEHEDVVERLWWDLWPTTEHDVLQANFRTALGNKKCSFRALGRATDAHQKIWQTELTPVADEYGVVTRVICVSRDITHF